MPKENQHLKTDSSKSGFSGALEVFARKNKALMYGAVYVFTVLICALLLMISLTPLAFYGIKALELTKDSSITIKAFSLSLALVMGFFSFMGSLIVLVPIVNTDILRLPKLLKPFRGNNYSIEAIPWFMHNIFLYLVRYTCLEFITPSPVNAWYFKRMGMKLGKNVVLNTSNISDACLITLGDNVFIGGSAHLLAHYSQSGFLVLSPLEIKKNSTVGLKATVFGNVIIGENQLVKPHEVVLPKSRIGITQPEDGLT